MCYHHRRRLYLLNKMYITEMADLDDIVDWAIIQRYYYNFFHVYILERTPD